MAEDFIPQVGDSVRITPGGAAEWVVWAISEVMPVARLHSMNNAWRDELFSNLAPWTKK